MSSSPSRVLFVFRTFYILFLWLDWIELDSICWVRLGLRLCQGFWVVSDNSLFSAPSNKAPYSMGNWIFNLIIFFKYILYRSKDKVRAGRLQSLRRCRTCISKKGPEAQHVIFIIIWTFIYLIYFSLYFCCSIHGNSSNFKYISLLLEL